ncbi:MAG: P-loop NTPase [candidate division KSB1 bacterium]|nr:P-loop NTPase [candidate division KSB1 bacterium]MDZ7294490.1 P-loop NTPase [candidate division KSB1 bacterium]MDZ7384882.1 P-loop NTPase [candidate division KSB1 bacterium]MDZ7391433.1 P-loop NTPase [candidate division KSB1 bacterium]MDZ7412913.1 P-loop NTPase [candidate division KSB1 bacterium]
MLVALGSGKGGVGKTTLALALAQHLCDRVHGVALVDADLGGKNLTAWLAPPGSDTPQVCSTSAQKCTIDPTGKLKLVSVCDAPVEAAEDGALATRLIRTVRALDVPLTIMDLGPGTAAFTLDCFLASELGILVTTPEPAAIHASFHFVEACLLHGLHKRSTGRPEANTLLRFLRKRAGDHTPLRQLLGGFNRGRHCLSSLFESLLEQMRIGIVVNCVREASDRRVGQALRAVLLDQLGLQAELWGYVPYRPELRRLMRATKTPGEQVQFFNGCLEQLTAIVELAATGLRKEWRPAFIPENAAGNGRTLVCSTKCSCWASCELRRGGYPCPIMPLGELKTLLTTAIE